MSAAQASATVAAHGVNFINEDDARRVLFALLKQVAHAARANAHEHFDEIGTGDGEERHIGLTRNRAGQQRLAGSRRADQQHAFGDASTQLLEFLRFAQEFDNFAQLFFGLIHAGNIFEGDFFLLHAEQAGAAFAKAQGLVAAGLHLPDHEEPESSQQQQRP